MSESKHTPGRWSITFGAGDQDDYFVVGADSPAGHRGVCEFSRANFPEPVSQGEMRANARLISAAPDLLALAEEVAKEYEDAADWKDACERLRRMAAAAVRKAKGG